MPDTIAGNTGTTSSMGADDRFTGTLETNGDRDWVRVELTSGDGIQINLNGVGGSGELSDPYLYLLDSNGDVVAQNDDVGGSFNSQITYAITQTGTYYIEASGYDDVETGDYEIITQEVTLPPPPSPLDSIAWGSGIEGNTTTTTDVETVNVYFATNGQTFDGYTSEGFNAYEQAQILAVMDDLSDVVNLEFNVVNNASNADLMLVLDLDEMAYTLGYFNPPGENNAGVGVFNGDLWDRSAGGDLEQGGNGYVTVVHELLHGLGMAHPHDDGGMSDIMEGVSTEFDDYGDYDLNQGVFTVMTYNSGYLTGTAGSAPAYGDYGFEGGAMALDIAYLQQLYGANTSHAGGANTYTMADTNEGGTYWKAIWDTGGTDTIRHDGSERSVIDLRAATLAYENGGGGFVSSVNGVAGGFTIANGVVIENAMGGSGNDTITGNGADNFLVGRGGNDRLVGGTGADVVRGSSGNDTLVGEGGNDKLYGGNGNDKSYGQAGNDRLYMDAGNDTLDGGSGTDWLYVTGSTNSVVNLAKTTAQITGYGTDIIKNIENASGGTGVDKFYGTTGNNTLKGNNGNDILHGRNGNDNLQGGNNNDKLYGGNGNDKLYGGSGRDILKGGNNNDKLYGNAGRDTLQGDAGKDTMFGGSGADTFVFRNTSDSKVSASKADIIRDFDQGTDHIDLSAIDASTTLDGNNAFTFDGTTSFGTSNEGGIYYEKFDNDGNANDYTMVYIDTDNDRGTEMSIKLMGLHNLTADDFIL